MDDIVFDVDVLLGSIECDSWFQKEVMPNGQQRLVGMCSRTDFDREGKATAHKIDKTGLVLYCQSEVPCDVSMARTEAFNSSDRFEEDVAEESKQPCLFGE